MLLAVMRETRKELERIIALTSQLRGSVGTPATPPTVTGGTSDRALARQFNRRQMPETERALKRRP